jgi:hypothetical protein
VVQQERHTYEELREVAGHLLWHVQQACFLALHLEERQGGAHVTRFDYPLDAAVLEAFLVHTRALADFLWGRRQRETDAVARDYFDPGSTEARDWEPRGRPPWYDRDRDVIGYGVLHVSYRRLKLDKRWAWQHRVIAHELIARIGRFANDVPTQRVDPGWGERVRDHVNPVLTYVPRDARAVGTPIIAFYRNPAAPIG